MTHNPNISCIYHYVAFSPNTIFSPVTAWWRIRARELASDVLNQLGTFCRGGGTQETRKRKWVAECKQQWRRPSSSSALDRSMRIKYKFYPTIQ